MNQNTFSAYNCMVWICLEASFTYVRLSNELYLFFANLRSDSSIFIFQFVLFKSNVIYMTFTNILIYYI